MSIVDRLADFTEISEDSDTLVLPPLWLEHWAELIKFRNSLEDEMNIASLKKRFTVFQRRTSYDWAYTRLKERHTKFLSIAAQIAPIRGIKIPPVKLPEYESWKETPFVRKAREVINYLFETPLQRDRDGESLVYDMRYSKHHIDEIIRNYNIEEALESYLVMLRSMNRFNPAADGE
jgi:hypothetical protein